MLQNADLGGRWRDALIQQIDPRTRDLILDVGCGTGELAVLLKLDSPGTSVFGLDARPACLDHAERRAYAADARVNFVHATFDDAEQRLTATSPTQIVCSRVLGHLTVRRRRALLAAMFAALPRGGVIHIADEIWRRRPGLFARLPWARTTPFTDVFLSVMRNAGFADCAVTCTVPAGNGHVAFFRGVKA